MACYKRNTLDFLLLWLYLNENKLFWYSFFSFQRIKKFSMRFINMYRHNTENVCLICIDKIFKRIQRFDYAWYQHLVGRSGLADDGFRNRCLLRHAYHVTRVSPTTPYATHKYGGQARQAWKTSNYVSMYAWVYPCKWTRVREKSICYCLVVGTAMSEISDKES